jgi:hypothetical protein
MNPGRPQNLQQFIACVVIVIHQPPPTAQLDAYYDFQRSHLASQKIYFLHPHFPSKPFLDCLGQACTHKLIAQKKNIIKNLIPSLVRISLPCGSANQPKKKIALQNPYLTFQVCAEFPCLCTICCGCTPCFLKDLSQVSSCHGFALSAAAAHLSQAFMPVHYLLLHTLLLQGFSQVSMPLHYLLLLRTTLYKRSGI